MYKVKPVPQHAKQAQKLDKVIALPTLDSGSKRG